MPRHRSFNRLNGSLSLSLCLFSGQIDREETKIASIGGVRSWRLARRQNGANKVRDRPSNCQTQRTMEHETRCGWGGGSRRLCIRQRPFIRYSTRQTATQTLLEIIRVWKYAWCRSLTNRLNGDAQLTAPIIPPPLRNFEKSCSISSNRSEDPRRIHCTAVRGNVNFSRNLVIFL